MIHDLSYNTINENNLLSVLFLNLPNFFPTNLCKSGWKSVAESLLFGYVDLRFIVKTNKPEIINLWFF